MTWEPGLPLPEARLCAECGVIVLPAGTGWEHPAELREKFSQSVCGAPRPGRAAKDREARYGRGNQTKQDRAVFGQLEVPPAEGPVVVGCDGAVKRNPDGPPWWPVCWGFVASNGRWGLGWAPQPAEEGGSRILASELRAVFWAVDRLPANRPLEVLTDSQDAVALIERWRAGDLVMPDGYSVARASGNEAKMVTLAQRIAAAPDRVRARWVRAGTDRLQRGADALAKTARMWAMQEQDARATREAGDHLAVAALASAQAARR